MRSARELGQRRVPRELPGRLVEDLGLVALVLAGHALGGGGATPAGLAALAAVTLAVTTLARRLPDRSASADVVLLLIAQAAGHLALAFGSGDPAHPATGRMLAGHALSTAVVAVLARHGRRCWHRAEELLAYAVGRRRIHVLPVWSRVGPCRAYQRDDDHRASRVCAGRSLTRRGPPRARRAAYA